MRSGSSGTRTSTYNRGSSSTPRSNYSNGNSSRRSSSYGTSRSSSSRSYSPASSVVVRAAAILPVGESADLLAEEVLLVAVVEDKTKGIN